jgi:glutamine synthetase
VGAADTTVLVRQTIRAVSQRRGLRVSFAPSVVAGAVGNGGHVHLSLEQDGHNVMAGGDLGLSPAGEAFTAGVLAELPALLAIGAPSVASYIRLVPQHWAGVFRCWGRENREAAVRLVTGPRGSEARATNVEVKCFDQAANPYLLVAALLAAGCAGLARRDRLPPEVEVDPADLSEEERADLGVDRLPERLADAVAAFEQSDTFREALGEPLTDTIAAVRRAEIELFRGATPDEVVAASRWRH